jgi:type VI secretion system protein ImpA
MAETLDVELPPISQDAPCGPDLDMEGDMAFMNFTASVEGQLPNSYFDFIAEPTSPIDFRVQLATAAGLKKRTQDLRLILLSAKLSILNRDFYAFAQGVAETAWLLQNRWDEVHPQAEGGRFDARLLQLATLDDSPVVVLPLQYATLLRTNRDTLNYRAVMITLGEAKLREGENLASAGTIERMLTKDVETEQLATLYATLARLRDDLDAIAAVTAERAGEENAVKFGPLAALVGKMLDFAQGALSRRDPSLAPAPAAAEAAEGADSESAAAPQSFAGLTDVDNALASALGYFQAKEPSSPALLLIAQARATLGKNLYEVIRLLAPSHVEAARVFVGPTGAFAIPVSSLQDAPALDFSPGEAEPAESRNQAFSIIEQVAAYLRVVEPSSPAPYLLDRARTLATRDFLSLLGEVFPPDHLESMKNGA